MSNNSVKTITHLEDLKSLFPGRAMVEEMLVVRNYSGGRLYLVLSRFIEKSRGEFTCVPDN